MRPSAPVHVVGYLSSESGLGEAARGYIRALQSLNVPVALTDISTISTNGSSAPTLTADAAPDECGIDLVCVNAQEHFSMLDALERANISCNRPKVAVWAWELATFPARWHDRFPYYDEIWGGSSFVTQAIAACSPVPVVRVPPALFPTKLGSSRRGRRALGVGLNYHVFLFVFDFNSYFARKNPLAVIDAFVAAFPSGESVRLVIKTINGSSHKAELRELCQHAGDRGVEVLDGHISAAAVRDLMAGCDTYVSLHRAEGTGLTMAEAMAHTKPVVATGWSGNVDFVDAASAFPVRYELIPIESDVGPYEAGEHWAEPSIDDAARILRYVVDHPEEATERARNGAKTIAARYSTQAIAELIGRRLALLEQRRRVRALARALRSAEVRYESLEAEFSDIRPYVPLDYLRYRCFREKFASVVKRHVRSNARVAVVSRGDEQLLRLDESDGWHFPRGIDGGYAGHHPATSVEAIAHLEALREEGVEFLVFPWSSFWWLAYYRDFAAHLGKRYSEIVADDAVCIFDLRAATRSEG